MKPAQIEYLRAIHAASTIGLATITAIVAALAAVENRHLWRITGWLVGGLAIAIAIGYWIAGLG